MVSLQEIAHWSDLCPVHVLTRKNMIWTVNSDVIKILNSPFRLDSHNNAFHFLLHKNNHPIQNCANLEIQIERFREIHPLET
jgi:hypothetical protein